MPNLKRIKDYFLGDGDGTSDLNRFMKKKQNIVGICVLLLLIIVTLVLHSLSEKKVKPPVSTQQKKTTSVDGILSTDFTQKNELSALEQQQTQMDRMRQSLERLRKQALTDKANSANHKAALLKEIKSILAKREAKQPLQKVKQPLSPNATPFSNTSNTGSHNTLHSVPNHSLETIQFHYTQPVHYRVSYQGQRPHRLGHVRTPRTYVPAGTFARGVLLEGADANASVNGQSDTVGILVRILDSGTLPNGHHSHLKGCFVLASIYGDISSERGEARLTTLSCTRANGTILEKKVQGYLSFAGKEGIKGHPVMRNGKILLMAGMSGMLSGFGSALQQSTQTQSISPLGSTTTIRPNRIWQNGLYGGASTAMSQLARYYIKRADQYHPIIEIGSGTVATIIFQRGFSLVDEHRAPSQTRANENAPVTTTKNNAREIKTLLQAAQQVARSKTTSPFSNVS